MSTTSSPVRRGLIAMFVLFNLYAFSGFFNGGAKRNLRSRSDPRFRVAYVLTINPDSPRSQHTKVLLERFGFGSVVFVEPDELGSDQWTKVWSNKNTFIKAMKQFLEEEPDMPWMYLFEDDVAVQKDAKFEDVIDGESNDELFQSLGLCAAEKTESGKYCGRCAHSFGLSRKGVEEFLVFNDQDEPALQPGGRTPKAEPFFDLTVQGWCNIKGGFPLLMPEAKAPVIQYHNGMFYQDRSAYKSMISGNAGMDLKKEKSNRRKFVSYTSSEWEKMWLENVDLWAEKRSICDELKGNQAKYVHDFLNLTCTARYEAPHDNWCVIDDSYRPFWYNTKNRDTFEVTWENPLPKDAKLGENKAVLPSKDHEHIASKFVFLDETTGEEYIEYIEPLVSHLRWPIAKCLDNTNADNWYDIVQIEHRGWLIPPARTDRIKRAVYLDAGASSWATGAGGPSLKYFFTVYARHGIHFDDAYAFEMTTPAEKFYDTIPPMFKDTIHYKQCAVSSQPEEETDENPFIPHFVKEHTQRDDYVVFKLDIDSPHVEVGNIDYILADQDNHIDEIVWEHHVRGNYLLEWEWRSPDLPDVSLRASYEFFLQMRQKGIRAHSWV